MLKIFKHLKLKEWMMMLVSVVFIVFQVWLDLKMPDYMHDITLLVNTPGSALSEIWQAGAMMLLIALGSLAGAIVVSFLGARIAANFGATLQAELFTKVESFGTEEINNFSTASLITRTTNDVRQVRMFIVMGLQILIKAPLLAVWAIIKILGKGYEWSLATAVTIVIMLIIFTVVLLLVIPKFKEMQKLTDDINHVTRENLQGQRVVRAYNAEQYESEKFEVANENLTKTTLFTGKMMSFLNPSISFLRNSLTLVIYLIGAFLINQAIGADKIDIYANMIVFTSYAMQVIMAFMMTIMIFMILPRASVSAKRILEVLETKPTIIEGSITEGDIALVGQIEFNNVSFKYPDAAEYVLKNINLKINRGETIAFIGSTGSGKSTLINLVPRFFDASEGEILIDGVNVQDYNLTSLYNKIGYVSQKAVLFKGIIAENVAYGENSKVKPTPENISEALRLAQALDFVEAMEGAQEGHVAQAGTNLSGGQKQRISIARAIFREPDIYIFDDSFSALDYQTDYKLRLALKKEMGHATSLIVAQRIGTIIDADKIVVLDSGEIVGIGTHQELLRSCEVYREIAYSQLSEEELAHA